MHCFLRGLLLELWVILLGGIVLFFLFNLFDAFEAIGEYAIFPWNKSQRVRFWTRIVSPTVFIIFMAYIIGLIACQK